MSLHQLMWETNRSPAELLAATNDDADYVAVVRSRIEPIDLPFVPIDAQPSPDIVIAYDPVARALWEQLRRRLPTSLFCLTARPEDDLAIAFAAKTLKSQQTIVNRSATICELAVRLAESVTVAFVAAPPSVIGPRIPVPQLTMPADGPRATWLREIVQRIQPVTIKLSQTDLTAFKAGLFLLHDFFEESHSCSQSIEGLGTHHTGDYWHAILHRREPDYGNAKYWFRHVGRHPAFDALAAEARSRLAAATGTLAAKLKRWRERLSKRDWDPLAFVDLCEAAESDAELMDWCEQIQHTEMLGLLEYGATQKQE